MTDVTLRRVGVMSVGDMGAGFGGVMHQNGLEVYTCLAGRSDLTRLRAQEAGFIDTPDLDALVSQVDLFISILVPSEATGLAERVAEAMIRTGAKPAYADANAIAPQTVVKIESIIRDAGANFIDAGIIGGPPRTGYTPFIPCSGPDTAIFQALTGYGLDVRPVGDQIGQASGLKMVYAASTKGTTALWTELLTGARVMGLEDALRAELGESEIFARQQRSIPGMPNRARRWVGEMEEIAKTFEDVGLTPKILLGAADMYALVSETPLADLTTRDPNPTLDEVITALQKRLSERKR
jgi:3-hydroxyisobutyrate dehydrogenase-like beta-hydroxyacid dehydrogenase